MTWRIALILALLVPVRCFEPPAPGVQIPPYTALTLEGQSFVLPDSNGRVLLLNLWATWCGPCRREIPGLKLLQQQYSARRFDVIGISVDTREDEDQVRKFVTNHQINYPVVLDPEGKMAVILNSVVLPTSALLDRTGKIVWAKVGVVNPNDAELRRALNRAL